MVRNFFRILILGLGVFLLYFWFAQKLNWVGLLFIILVLFLFYLATYVTPLEQNSGGGIPPTLKEYFKGSVLFRTDNRGRIIFYPWGIWGIGYCVPDISTEEDIRNFIMLYSGITGAITALGILLEMENTMWLSIFLFIPIEFLWYRIKIANLTQGLEEVPKDSEYYSPPIIDNRYRTFLFVMLILGLIGGVGNIYNKGFSVNNILLGVFSAAFLVLFGYTKWIRK